MLDQALDPAEALGEREQAHVLEKAAWPCRVRTKLHRDHAAAAMHLALGELVLGWLSRPG